MAIIQLNVVWVLLVASFIRGFAGGTLWNAQAVYLSNLCERHPGQTGRLSGLFFGVFSFQVLVGSLIMGIPLLLSPADATPPTDPAAALDSVRTMLWVLTGLGGLAAVLFCFLRPVEPLKPVAPEPFFDHIKDTFALFKRRDMQLLLVWAFMFGYVICFMWGPVSTLYGNLRLVPMLFVGFGASFTIASFSTGKIYDSKGWKPLLIIYLVAHVVAYIAFSIGYTLKVDALFYIAAIMFGWIESELGTLNEAVFIEVFSECTSHAFACTRQIFLHHSYSLSHTAFFSG
jgi:MFS family permease